MAENRAAEGVWVANCPPAKTTLPGGLFMADDRAGTLWTTLADIFVDAWITGAPVGGRSVGPPSTTPLSANGCARAQTWAGAPSPTLGGPFVARGASLGDAMETPHAKQQTARADRSCMRYPISAFSRLSQIPKSVLPARREESILTSG